MNENVTLGEVWDYIPESGVKFADLPALATFARIMDSPDVPKEGAALTPESGLQVTAITPLGRILSALRQIDELGLPEVLCWLVLGLGVTYFAVRWVLS